MLKAALIGGLLVAFGFSALSVGDVLFGLIGLGSALLVLAVVIDILAGFLEWVGRRWNGMHHGVPVRLHRSRSAS
jgi:hypothetical protein